MVIEVYWTFSSYVKRERSNAIHCDLKLTGGKIRQLKNKQPVGLVDVLSYDRLIS